MVEYFIAQVFIIAVLLIYILCFCVPAFIITLKEDDPFTNSSSCLSFIICVIGLPGYFLGTVAWLIKDSVKEKKHKEMQAEEQKRAKIAAERRAAEAERIRCEQRPRIDHYRNSPLMPDIMRFLRQHGTPNQIKIHFDYIEMVYHGGVDRYDFLTHSINSFMHPLPKGYKINTSELYFLGCAINEEFGGRFDVCEHTIDSSVERNDEWVVFRDLQYVLMHRQLNDF